ncbi:unnamed protein product [Orchesella dallaii]|uniref:Galectin n=1 Tax=Orchesella dallaii TaxID=48710 RepID=A0ABP1PK09_9HEXA
MIHFCFLILITFQACHGMSEKDLEIPFVTKLDKKLSVGDKITVTGRVLPTAANRFAINIRHGWMDIGGLVLFHFDVRFSKSHVITNTHIDGPQWLEPETTNFGSHFRKGNDFMVEITCQEDKFDVMVDGESFLEYKYELPLKIADMLEITGYQYREVKIFSANVNNSSTNSKRISLGGERNWNLNERDTFENNCTCDSQSPYLAGFLIFFILLAIVFFVIILRLTGWLDFCQPKKLCTWF